MSAEDQVMHAFQHVSSPSARSLMEILASPPLQLPSNTETLL